MKKQHKKDWHDLSVGLIGALGVCILGCGMLATTIYLVNQMG
jgi:hypothetical protein